MRMSAHDPLRTLASADYAPDLPIGGSCPIPFVALATRHRAEPRPRNLADGNSLFCMQLLIIDIVTNAILVLETDE